MYRRALIPVSRRPLRLPRRWFGGEKTKEDPKDLKKKWTQRKEAPAWMQRMAPTKGGTTLPTPKEFAVIAIVAAAGYYAWFVEPPKQKKEE